MGTVLQSLSRPVVVAFVAAAVAGSPSGLRAESVFLRGYEVTPKHIVFGSIERLLGNQAIINLGFGHGMVTGETLVVVRRVDEELIPVCGLLVLQTEPDHSRARIEGPFRPAVKDLVLIHASRLQIWGGIPRFDRLARERIVRRQAGAGYNTLDASPELIDEVARDDAFQGRQYKGVTVESMIREAADKAGPVSSPLGAVLPLPVLNPEPGEATESQSTSNPTVAALSRFVEVAQSPAQLIPRMSTERLQRLRVVGQQPDVEEGNAPLYREVLLAWLKRGLESA